MTDREKIIAEIERLKHYGIIPYDKDVFKGVCMIESFINSLPVKQTIEGLDVEINLEYKSNYKLKELTLEEFRTIVYHFANWQKQQMLRSAIDAKIVNDETSGCVVDSEKGCLVLEPHTYPIGQKLKILIIKEDEQ